MALEQRILPELIARLRPQRRLRIWSAACSTGEEAYTLAILVARLLPDLAEWDVRILATDINERSVERARRGVYRAWSFRGAQRPSDLAPYITGSEERFEVAPGLRAMVTFRQLNLTEDHLYPSRATGTQAIDLILCRNVLMYFDEDAGRAVVGRLRSALGDGGFLLVSQVEAGLQLFDGLVRDAPATAIYRKIQAKSPDAGKASAGDSRGAGWEPRIRELTPPPSPPVRPSPSVDPDESAPAPGDAIRLWKAGLPDAALRQLDLLIAIRPLDAHLHYLHGMILLDGARTDEALASLRRCSYADPQFVLGHLAQATLFARTGQRGRARVALETTARLVADLVPDAVVCDGDDLTAGDVFELIAAHRALLDPPDTAERAHG